VSGEAATRSLLVAGVMLALATGGAMGAGVKRAAARLPSPAEAGAVCRMIAARGPAIASALVRDGVLDANNDGTRDTATVVTQGGTMRGEDLQFRPRLAFTDSPAVEVRPEGFQPGDYLPFGARWLPWRGKVYTLYFDAEDLRVASYLGYIDATNAEHLVCDFTSSDKETFRPVARDAEALCRAVTQGQVDYASVAEMQEADPDLPSERWMTRVAGRITVDFANRGKPVPLALLALESGAGRGCTFGYFDAILDGKVASTGDAHAALMRLQDVELRNDGGQVYTASRCDGSAPRWFVRDGVTYLDIVGGPDVRGTEPFHEVRVLRGTQPETRCKATFAARWSVKSMGPEFK
jgi:hypothetical protein